MFLYKLKNTVRNTRAISSLYAKLRCCWLTYRPQTWDLQSTRCILFLNKQLTEWDIKSTVTFTCGHTPSTASTTTMAPSHSLTAVETSDEKSTWPGESIRFSKYSWSPEETRSTQTLFGVLAFCDSYCHSDIEQVNRQGCLVKWKFKLKNANYKSHTKWKVKEMFFLVITKEIFCQG